MSRQRFDRSNNSWNPNFHSNDPNINFDTSAIPSPVPERVFPELEIKPVVKSIWAYNKVKEQEDQRALEKKINPLLFNNRSQHKYITLL